MKQWLSKQGGSLNKKNINVGEGISGSVLEAQHYCQHRQNHFNGASPDMTKELSDCSYHHHHQHHQQQQQQLQSAPFFYCTHVCSICALEVNGVMSSVTVQRLFGI